MIETEDSTSVPTATPCSDVQIIINPEPPDIRIQIEELPPEDNILESSEHGPCVRPQESITEDPPLVEEDTPTSEPC